MSRARTIANYGDGLEAADIPSLAASKITSGSFADARIPSLAASKTTSGSFDAARIPALTTLGTVTSGTWEGDTITVPQGGTGATTHSGTAILVGAADAAITSIDPGDDGDVLTSNGTVWQSATAPTGTVVKIESITFTDVASTTGAATPNFALISGTTQGAFEKAITITSGNHVLILYDLAINTDSDATRFYIRLMRNHSGTDYVLDKKGDLAGSKERVTIVGGVTHREHMYNVAGSFLDIGDSSVSTLSGTETYKLFWCANDNGYTVRINRSYTESNNANSARSASTLTLMEIQV